MFVTELARLIVTPVKPLELPTPILLALEARSLARLLEDWVLLLGGTCLFGSQLRFLVHQLFKN